jgi:hypothetical protein
MHQAIIHLKNSLSSLSSDLLVLRNTMYHSMTAEAWHNYHWLDWRCRNGDQGAIMGFLGSILGAFLPTTPDDPGGGISLSSSNHPILMSFPASDKCQRPEISIPF